MYHPKMQDPAINAYFSKNQKIVRITLIKPEKQRYMVMPENGSYEKLHLTYYLFLLLYLLYILVCLIDRKAHTTDARGCEVPRDHSSEQMGFLKYMISKSMKLACTWDNRTIRDAYLSYSLMYPEIDTIPVINSQNTSYNLNYEKFFPINLSRRYSP